MSPPASAIAVRRLDDDAALDADLDRWLGGAAFRDYVYGYPHKTAYRAFDVAMPLREVWAEESRDKPLQLYVHVPFCEMRCGFCNLFTVTDAGRDHVAPFLAALKRQAEATAEALGARRYTSFAIGGGTPTFLSPGELEQVFAVMRRVGGAPATGAPLSVEVSPQTATAERLAVLKARGTTRVSIGVQSFDAAEQKAYGRGRDARAIDAALTRIRAHGFETLNIDLIYGGPLQTLASWMQSVEAALAWQPEELFLYPLYVRPLTGLAGRADPQDAMRLACYRAARKRLMDAGYRQVSLRQFRRGGAGESGAGTGDDVADEGMVGLGPGARSYTQSLHYSSEYAVGRSGVLAILDDYAARTTADFADARFGVRLDASEQRRRAVLLALMQCAGLDLAGYRRAFASEAIADFPELDALRRRGLITVDAAHVALTEAGLELSDSIGSWLYSATMRRRMEDYAWR